jgi:hypothetical protein
MLAKWMKATKAVDPTGQLNATYLEMETCLNEIKRRAGGFHKDLILALIFHQRCQSSYQEIANALDACISVNKTTSISSKSVLELASRFESGTQATGSVFAYGSQIGAGQQQSEGTSSQTPQLSLQGRGGRKADPSSVMWRTDAWAR